jgi:dienelactone hydrolase
MNFNPDNVHSSILKAITPALRYGGGDVKAWQKKARERLSELLGFNRIEAASDDMLTVKKEAASEGYAEYSITFQSEEGYFVPATLFIPEGKEAPEGKIPLVICLQGHSTGKHISLGKPKFPGDEKTISGGDRDFAKQIVKEGYAALAVEQRGFGECGGTPEGPACKHPTMTALLAGRTTIGERVFDIKRAIDVVTGAFDALDADKIACMGNSGGGTATIYAAAMLEEIKMAMPSCALCTFKDSIAAMEHCTCNYVPGIALDFDMGDLCGLIAPRPLLVVSGHEDRIFPYFGVEESIGVAKKYYEAFGADEKLDWVEGPEGHRFYAALSWPKFHKMFD